MNRIFNLARHCSIRSASVAMGKCKLGTEGPANDWLCHTAALIKVFKCARLQPAGVFDTRGLCLLTLGENER